MTRQDAYALIVNWLTDSEHYPDEGWTPELVTEVDAMRDIDDVWSKEYRRRRKALPGKGRSGSADDAETALDLFEWMGSIPSRDTVR